MGSKLLTFKDRKTGKRHVFNPLFIGCINEHATEDDIIIVSMMASMDDTSWWINYPYDEALKRWQDTINS